MLKSVTYSKVVSSVFLLLCFYYILLVFSTDNNSGKGFWKEINDGWWNDDDINVSLEDSTKIQPIIGGLSGIKLLRYFNDNLDYLNKHIPKHFHPYNNNYNQGNTTNASSNKVVVSSYYDLFWKFILSNKLDTQSMIEVLTRDVDPLNSVHSHNDYWRALPLFDALLHGVNSVEADVWLVEDYDNTTLAVGHNNLYLNPEHKNLKKLYLDPMVYMLNEINHDNNVTYGMFYNSPETTTFLFIDFKSEDSVKTYNVLVESHLSTISRYLTYRRGTPSNDGTIENTIVWKPITIILTGNYPDLHGHEDEMLKPYIFFDIDFDDFTSKEAAIQILKEKRDAVLITSSSMSKLIASCYSNSEDYESYSGIRKLPFYPREMAHFEIRCIKNKINIAHEVNLETRIWGVPEWPIHIRNTLWKQQYNELNSNFLNTNDLDAIIAF
ncbi:uncharacterized protein SCODWIG_01926 [Saccharomycodes ludwigii]|uniref:Altered inheritance of mitochondria protein 6 n=1 Tax=Saccharomycodes ludwigii TaxID=36035 RepID=A0A376B640_9ASCO|nr:hypothetical protein SCDLUD_003025 [Saccharomycodes ludwigii]KAH3901528.1 hypothetical protein SCDLUD_003025 [Saccharomycodes ludwigii]SSD60165.1 uncharacterized protein SCODWIG_01926 [Saccharomycodes ludwigii]